MASIVASCCTSSTGLVCCSSLATTELANHTQKRQTCFSMGHRHLISNASLMSSRLTEARDINQSIHTIVLHLYTIDTHTTLSTFAFTCTNIHTLYTRSDFF
jgi:hypothetical protein